MSDPGSAVSGPSSSGHGKRWLVVFVVFALVVVLVPYVAIAHTDLFRVKHPGIGGAAASPTPAQDASASPTPSAPATTPTPPPALAPAPKPIPTPKPRCPNVHAVLPAHWVGQSVKLAQTKNFKQDLTAYRKNGANAIAYMGDNVGPRKAVNIIDDIWCAGLVPFFSTDRLFDALHGIQPTKAYLQKLVDQRSGQIGYFIEEDRAGKHSVNEINRRVDAIESVTQGTNIKVMTIEECSSKGLEEAIRKSRSLHGDLHVIGYYPFVGSLDYGDAQQLAIVAEAEADMDGSEAVAAVQQFTWANVDPATSEKYHFSGLNIQRLDIANSAVSMLNHGAQSILLIGKGEESLRPDLARNSISDVSQVVRKYKFGQQ